MSFKFIPGPQGQALSDDSFVQSAVQQQEREAHANAAWTTVGFAAVAIAIIGAFVVRRHFRKARRQKAE